VLARPAAAAGLGATARARLGERFGEEALRDALAAAYTERGQPIQRGRPIQTVLIGK
jgi:hypothetical protein